ncbi:MAG: hypothetical protein JO353_10785, partial [Phycisphaerae bacterium]|nr:hypothetical protein [Phycisphaerae bacterium]
MPDSRTPNSASPNSTTSSSADMGFAVALLLALAIVAIGVYQAIEFRIWTLLALGIVATAVVIAGWSAIRAIFASRQTRDVALRSDFQILSERLEQISVMLTLVSEQQLLSDRAKSVAFREKERDALRRAIQEEMAHGDFEAATGLTNEIEASFGLKQEADRFRQDISSRRAEIVRRQIN